MARNWADLSRELLELCSQHLCPQGLVGVPSKRSNVPWMMLEDNHETLWHECFCLSCQRVHRVLMPEAKGKTCFSSRGWVFTLGRDWEVYMLKNPMSRHNYIIKLPKLKFPDIEDLPHYDYFSAKFVLSASPTTSLDYMVMVIYGRGGRLGLWKPGDKEWTAVDYPSPTYWDLVFYKGCFVAVDCEGSILRCDVNGPTPFETQVIFRMPRRLMNWEHPDLVQPTTGHRLLMTGVFEIDLNTQTYTEVKSLGSTSLFLGSNSSFYLEANEEHHIKPNCIYFADDSWPQLSEEGGGRDMGIYHIEDCTTELYFMAMAYDHYPLPLWIEPSF
ncbi:hypothetical protein EUGRSUZ_H00636 [Eucalyptus grandis]|uniref:Uncharacterized protein n=2 Tax=Eucalyptus grandis TaxID=71139 RepID=A0ACC3JN00_EUCGR|nr:hypothetical protein EUGRSUZ_H00636 [Eucalyptus grandis]